MLRALVTATASLPARTADAARPAGTTGSASRASCKAAVAGESACAVVRRTVCMSVCNGVLNSRQVSVLGGNDLDILMMRALSAGNTVLSRTSAGGQQ